MVSFALSSILIPDSSFIVAPDLFRNPDTITSFASLSTSYLVSSSQFQGVLKRNNPCETLTLRTLPIPKRLPNAIIMKKTEPRRIHQLWKVCRSDAYPKRRKSSRQTLKKYEMLKDFLIILGIDEKTVEIDACRIEHVLTFQTMRKLSKFVHFFQWLQSLMWVECFENYCKTGQLPVCTMNETVKCKHLD